MVDTFHPLHVTQAAMDLDDANYPYSWLPPEDAEAHARELSERGPEAFPTELAASGSTVVRDRRRCRRRWRRHRFSQERSSAARGICPGSGVHTSIVVRIDLISCTAPP